MPALTARLDRVARLARWVRQMQADGGKLCRCACGRLTHSLMCGLCAEENRLAPAGADCVPVSVISPDSVVTTAGGEPPPEPLISMSNWSYPATLTDCNGLRYRLKSTAHHIGGITMVALYVRKGREYTPSLEYILAREKGEVISPTMCALG